MSTNITNAGAEKNGNILFEWSNDPNFAVDSIDGIKVSVGVSANTRNGDDIISGKVSSGLAVNNEGSLRTGTGGDLILADVAGNSSNGNTALSNSGVLRTQRDTDQVRGNVVLQGRGDFNTGLRNENLINTGSENDIVFGGVTVGSGDNNIGLDNGRGTVSTGSGHDWIIGDVTVGGDGGSNNIGVFNGNLLNTGAGIDKLYGEVEGNGTGLLNTGIIRMGNEFDELNGTVTGDGYGIDNTGIINMGTGGDIIRGIGKDALSGFTGGGRVNLGNGNDSIFGFGDQIVNGGGGTDYARFEFALDGDVTLGSSSGNAIDITVDGVTMSFRNVEYFNFFGNDQSLSNLIDMV